VVPLVTPTHDKVEAVVGFPYTSKTAEVNAEPPAIEIPTLNADEATLGAVNVKVNEEP